MTAARIRSARPDEAQALSALALRSKGHWNYDAAFLALCAPVLSVRQADINQGNVRVAEGSGGEVLGSAVIAPPDQSGADQSGEGELDMLFVDPPAIGSGVGAMLFHDATQLLRRRGATSVIVAADPGAEGFYPRMGAVGAGTIASEVDPTRKLPLLPILLD